MRGVLKGSVRDMRYEKDHDRDVMKVTIVLDVYAKPDFENTNYMPGEFVDVCFGGALPQPMRPLYEVPMADAPDERSSSW
jgi:hypothetical protein